MKRRKKKRIIYLIISIVFLLILGVFLGGILLRNEPETEEKSAENRVEKNEDAGDETEEEFDKNPDVKESGQYTDRYAIYYADGAQDVKIASNDIYRELNQQFAMIHKYLVEIVSSYKVEQQIDCTEVTLLDWCYVETEDASRKINIFGELNDADQTLVTIVYAPAANGNNMILDCMPCQYTIEEIENQAWYEEEVQ